MNRTEFLVKHNLRLCYGDAFNLPYVTDGKGFKSYLLGTMLYHPKCMNYDSTREVALFYPNRPTNIRLLKTDLENGNSREMKLAKEWYLINWLKGEEWIKMNEAFEGGERLDVGILDQLEHDSLMVFAKEILANVYGVSGEDIINKIEGE